jgi:RNA polymerase sigma-70 factor (ECF subfamily)
LVPCENTDQRLSLIPTLWSLVYRAHAGAGEAVKPARQQILERYGGAVRRYLHKVLHDPQAADEVFQEFALQVLHGDLRGANPDRGRFRNFVKGTLFHLIADYRNEQRKQPRPLPEDSALMPAAVDGAESDRDFLTSWCDELLARAWEALAEHERNTGQPFYTVLRYRADHPKFRAPQLAEQLGQQLGKSLTSAGIRQTLHRAREKFGALLLDEVIHSLEDPTTEQLEEELAELGLLNYCGPVLQKRQLNM